MYVTVVCGAIMYVVQFWWLSVLKIVKHWIKDIERKSGFILYIVVSPFLISPEKLMEMPWVIYAWSLHISLVAVGVKWQFENHFILRAILPRWHYIPYVWLVQVQHMGWREIWFPLFKVHHCNPSTVLPSLFHLSSESVCSVRTEHSVLLSVSLKNLESILGGVREAISNVASPSLLAVTKDHSCRFTIYGCFKLWSVLL